MKFSMRYILMALAIRTYIICHLTLLWYYRTTIVLCNFDWYTWLHQISLNFPMSRNARSMYNVHLFMSLLHSLSSVTIHPRHSHTCSFSSLFNRISISIGNSGLCWTVFARNRDTAVPAEGNGDLQKLICVLAARFRRCSTLSNPVFWLNCMAAYPGCTLQMKTLFPGWPIMVHDMHTRRRILVQTCLYLVLELP